ncbi:predicted protein [Streptomyces viridosporus ATCC 14672]|uniref:Predicted protein n=1 Tax=Streptomyces viridosporus (strain ATCC 14672 / DSM 40746 / JCM 4963 / KCTC 9882 / NRRL B-12104 / FH 1290) TaxID=566461 RepID=D5ZU38_STRV1|nr:predicted protein [Streptomyces viridosporus ATCC 14672]
MWLRHRFLLPFCEAEEPKFEHGAPVSYESVRRRCAELGQVHASALRRRTTGKDQPGVHRTGPPPHPAGEGIASRGTETLPARASAVYLCGLLSEPGPNTPTHKEQLLP